MTSVWTGYKYSCHGDRAGVQSNDDTLEKAKKKTKMEWKSHSNRCYTMFNIIYSNSDAQAHAHCTQVCLCNSLSGSGASCRWTVFRHIDGLQWLAFILFGSRGPGLVDWGLRAQNAIFLPNKYTRATDVTASINAGDVKVCVCECALLWSKHIIHPSLSPSALRRRNYACMHACAGHTQTRRGTLMFGLVSTNK